MAPVLECKDLVKIFDFANKNQNEPPNVVYALDKIDFQLFDGDRLGLIGLNGSGKSTLLKIISGIIKPSSGKVILREKVTALSSFDSLLQPDLTGIENVILQLKLLGLGNNEIQKLIPEIIEFSELKAFINQPIKTYSSGMMLRLSIAIFKITKPAILLLDEVFSAGDTMFQKKVDELMQDQFKNLSVLILASHQISEILKYCNKCLVLNKGRLEYFGNMKDAMAIYHKPNNTFDGFKVENEFVVFNKIFTNNPENTFSVDEAIEISIEFCKMDDTVDFTPSIYLYNYSNYVLTDCLRYRRNFENSKIEAGNYRYTVILPANLINVGEFVVDLVFGDVNKVYLEIKEAIRFTISPADWERSSNYEIPSIYPIRPQLIWKAIKLQTPL